MTLQWKNGGKWWLGTECGSYTIAKAICGGAPRYSAYAGRQLLGAHDSAADAKAQCEAHHG